MANVIHSTLTYNANLTPAQAQIKALTGQIATLTAAFNALDKSAMKTQAQLASSFMTGAGQIGGFTTQMVKTNAAVDAFGQAIAKNRLTMRQYFREAFVGLKGQQNMMTKLAKQQVMMQQSMLVPLGAGAGGAGRAALITPTSLDALASKSALAAKKFSIFNQLIDGGSTRLLNFGKNTQWTGRQLMVGFTLPLIMFTALVSKQFREIDKELTRFEKVYGADLAQSVEGATKKMRDQVEQLAYDISAAYGIAAKDTAALAADIAQTGKEGQALLDSIRQTTRLSVLGEVERQEAMQATLSIQNAFKLNTNELAESIDFLNAVENQTSTNLQDLAGAIPRVGPVIQSLNGDIKDMSLLLVAMREGGVAAGEAANALKSGLGRLINPTKQAKDAAASFGISLDDIIQNSRGQLIPMIFALQDALGGLDDFARAQVIEKLFGKYQFARMSALFTNLRRQGSQTLDVMELASASSVELAKIANEELATLQQSTAMRFSRTVESLKNSLLPLGELLTESLIPVLSGIGNAIRSFMDFFSALPGPLKDFTKFAVVVTALAGPVVMLVGLFGNLAANGIKFLMGLTRIGAKLMGMKVEKFELLTRDVMAAQLGVDGLTISFMEQDVALRKLAGSLTTYSAQLRQALALNPSFAIAGAPRPGQIPIRRQGGSDRPEFVPGSGRGDKIPAMLEPGEFVVNRKAAEKFAPILVEMNKGNVQGFAKGTQETHLTGSKMVPASTLVATQGLAKAVEGNLRLLGNQLIQVFSNLVVSLPSKINQDLRVGQPGVPASAISTLLKDQQTWSNIMKNTGLTFQELQPVIKSVTSGLDRLDNEIINDPKLYQMVEASLATLSTQGDRAAKVLQILSSQYGTFDLKRGQIESIIRQGGSPVIKETGQRERLGVGVAPSYTTPLTGRGQLLQNKPYMDIAGGARVAPGSVAVAQEIANVQKQELGWAKRRVQAASSIEKYMKMREKLLINITNSENQEANIRAELTRITRDSKIPLEEKLRLQKSLNAQILAERAERERMAGIVKRIDTDIANAKQRELNALKSGIGRGPGGSYGYLAGGASPYAAAPVGAGVPVLLRDRVREANANRPRTPIQGTTVGPNKDGMQMAGPRGQGRMNAAFMSTMLISSFSMMGGASNDLAIKLGLLSTAVMTATMAMQMFAGKNVAGNFLGLGSLGKKVSAAGAARNAAANAAMLPGQALIAGPKLPVGAPAGGMMPMTAAKGAAGAGLLRMGGMLSMLGGPVGMAAAAVAVAGVTGFIMYKKAAEEARERAMSAFADPAKTAEYFGLAVEDVTEKLKAVSSAVPGIEEVDQNLREAVKGDYAVLIEKLRFSGAEAGGRELGIVFNKMLASGLSKEQAEEAVKAIAIESGAAGGAAYADAMRKGMFADKDAAQIAQSTADMFNPEKQARNRAQAQQTLTAFENEVGVLGRIQGTMAQNFDNTFGDVMAGATSFAANLNPIMQGIRAVTDFDMFERMFDKDAQQEFIDNAANTEKQIHQMQTGIEEMADVTGDSIVKITEIMFENFKKAPRETVEAFREIQEAGQRSSAVAFDTQPIKDFITEIDPINGIILNALIGQDEEIGTRVMEAIAAGMSVQEIIDSLTTGGIPSLEIEVELKVREQELTVQLDEMKANLKEDLVVDLDLQIEKEEEQLEGVNKELERMDKFRARHEGVLKKEMNRLNRASQSAIDSMQNEIDTIRERADVRKEEFDERIDDLNKEKEEINKATDNYIDSLRKRERADNFYSNQRKTAFSALQKLSAGDVFGFLQDREQMSADAQTFAYDNMIQGIEDKRDKEIESIDETIEKEQERQEKYEKNVEDRIELIQDQIDAEEELMDQRQKDFDREMRFFDRKQKRRREELDDEKRELQVSLDQLRATRQAAESGQIQSQKELSKALGEEKARPYFEEQKAIVKTEMMKKYIEVRDKYPNETEAESQMRAHGELIDLFNALYGVTPGQGRRPSMGWAQQLEDIGFTPNFNTGGAVSGPGTSTSDSIPALLSNGEYVVRASSVSKYGKEMMESINAGRYADGGYVHDSHAAYIESLSRPKPTTTYYDSHQSPSSAYASRSEKRGRGFWETGKKRRTIGIIMGGIGEQSAERRAALAYAMSKYNVDLDNPYSWKKLTRRQKWDIYKATQTDPRKYSPSSSDSNTPEVSGGATTTSPRRTPRNTNWLGTGKTQPQFSDPNNNRSEQAYSKDDRVTLGSALEEFSNWVMGWLKFAKGGPVEMKKALDKWAGPKLKYHSGWNSAGTWGKPYPSGIMMHHTSSPATDAQVDAMRDGYGGISGPIVQSVISRDGTGHIIGYGNRNTGAGHGTTQYMGGDPTNQGPQKDLDVMKGILDAAGGANPALFQMEVISDGIRKDFTAAQFDTIAKISAGLRDWMSWPTFKGRIINHKDWAGYRTDGSAKADTLYARSEFESNANDIWSKGGGTPENTGNNNGKNRRGAKNDRVKKGDVIFGDMTGGGSRSGFGRAAAKYLMRSIMPLQGKKDDGGGNSGTPGGRGITLDPEDYQDSLVKGFNLVKLIYGSGWKNKEDVRTAYGVVMGESGGNRKAKNDNWAKGSKGIDWGLWQINDYWHKEVAGKKIDYSQQRIFDAIYNSKIANQMWRDPKNHGGDSQTPWGGWNAYRDKTTQYNLGLKEFDNNPNWWRQIVTLTGGNNGNNNGGGGNGGTSDAANSTISYARSQVGDPYRVPSSPPNSWDCSTLTAWAWAVGTGGNKDKGYNDPNAKVRLPALSHEQGNLIRKSVVSKGPGSSISGLSVGDILYFAPNGRGVYPGHVSLYAGDGKVIQASTPETGVISSPVNSDWNKKYFEWAGKPKGFASGGSVFGPGGPKSDSIPAMLSNGEYVMNAGSVKKYGKGFMDKINSGQLGNTSVVPAGFANGGMVSPSFNVPVNNTISSSDLMNNINNISAGGNSSTSNSSNVKIVINGSGTNAKAVANQVVKMINNYTYRRDHSRSAG